MAVAALSPGEVSQLQQTIEMFEVIVQSQPNDCQSLEILKEAYSKLRRESDVVATSKRIAKAYMQTGQLSSAILELETVLQRCPDDAEVQAALQEIESRANNAGMPAAGGGLSALGLDGKPVPLKRMRPAQEIDDGRKSFYKIFVENKAISATDFDKCWPGRDLSETVKDVVVPFIHVLHEKKILPVDESLKLLSEKSRMAYLPLDNYDVDIDLTRGFPAQVCRRWCVQPFDRMSKAILVATSNPFNQQAIKELSEATSHRLVWYLVPPADLLANPRKAFR